VMHTVLSVAVVAAGDCRGSRMSKRHLELVESQQVERTFGH